MKKLIILLVFVLLLIGAVFFYNEFTGKAIYDGNEVVLYEFWGDGCPYCAALDKFLDRIKDNYPSLIIKKYEVWHDENNRKFMEEMAGSYGVNVEGVPAVFINDRFIAGFGSSTGEEIESEIQKCLNEYCTNPKNK